MLLKKHEEWPEELTSGMIKTKNRMGIMTLELSPPSQAFINFSTKAKKPLLDVGCAYGAATLPALQRGAKLIGCDLSDEHLNILENAIPLDLKENFTPILGAFPDILNFEKESLSGIHIAQVLHFLPGETIQNALSKCYDWLEPDGKLFTVTITPYQGMFDANKLINAYQKNEENNIKWPGEVNPQQFAKMGWEEHLPEFGHFLDMQHLEQIMQGAGFIIESMDYFCYDSIPDEYKTNGKEYIGMVAVKK